MKILFCHNYYQQRGGEDQVFEDEARHRYSWLDEKLLHRLLRAYGTRIEKVLGPAQCVSDLGRDFGAGLHEAEVDYLLRHEFAATTDDILWRRSKLGLRLDAVQVRSLDRWLGGDVDAASM